MRWEEPLLTCFCGAAGAFPRCSCSSAGCWRTMLLAMVRVLGCQSCSPGGTWRSVFAEHSGGCWWPLLLELNWEVRGQAVPQALGPSLQGEMCLLYEDMGCGGSWQGLCTVGAARPVCNRGVVRGRLAPGEGCAVPGASGWSSQTCTDPTGQPQRDAAGPCPAVPTALAAFCCSSFSLRSVAKAAHAGTLSLLHQPHTHNPIKNTIKLL